MIHALDRRGRVKRFVSEQQPFTSYNDFVSEQQPFTSYNDSVSPLGGRMLDNSHTSTTISHLRRGSDTPGAGIHPEPSGPADLELKLPLVSIIIANYNYARYVRAAIRSVQAQSYRQLECIVVDDCSTDNSFELITQYLDSLNDKRFRSVRLERNLGQMGAIKVGLDHCSGVFTVILDADDMLLPDFTRRHVSTLLNTSFSAGVSASDTLQVDEHGQVLETTFHTFLKHRSDQPSAPIKPIPADAVNSLDTTGRFSLRPSPNPSCCYIERSVHDWHIVQMSALMFRTDLLRYVVPDDTENARICADYYLYLCSHHLTGTLMISSALSCFRLHRKNGFSINPALGGSYHPGRFSDDIKQKLHREIAKHVIANFDTLAALAGLGACEKLIRRSLPRHHIYDALKHHPALQIHFGRGSIWRFRAKYLLYRLLKRR